MNVFVWIVAGIAIGWIASMLNTSAGREDLIRNVVTGVGGAFVGGWLLGELFGPANSGSFSFGAMFASIIGAAALLYVMARLNRA